MSEYKRFEIKGRGFRYMKNGKLVSKNNVPVEELERLATEDVSVAPEVKPETLPEENVEVTDRACIFCGMYSTWTRFVNQQSVAICQEHYYSETVGKVAQKMREMELSNA